MIGHWVKPDTDSSAASFPQGSVGKQVISFFPEMADIPRGSVVLLGYDDYSGLIRKQLYKLYGAFPGLHIVDVGILRKANETFAQQVVRELVDGGMIVVLFGAPEDLSFSPFQAYHEFHRGVSVVWITDRVTTAKPTKNRPGRLLDRLHKAPKQQLFHLSILGFQRHLSDPKLLMELQDQQVYDLANLGKVVRYPDDMEPLIRDADLMAVDLSVVKGGDAPGVLRPGPNGLDGITLAQMVRYAGLSDKMQSISFGGWVPSRDRMQITAQISAQMIWYFLEGVSQRRGDFPVSMDGLVEYHVDLRHMNEHLVFWKSNKSGRWWMQVPISDDPEGMARHRLVACTYQDYQEACRDELPERLLQAQLRFRKGGA